MRVLVIVPPLGVNKPPLGDGNGGGDDDDDNVVVVVVVVVILLRDETIASLLGGFGDC